MVFIRAAEKESTYWLKESAHLMSPYDNSQPFSSSPLPKPEERDLDLSP